MIRKLLVIVGSIFVPSFICILAIIALNIAKPRPDVTEPELQAPAVFYIEAESESLSLDVVSQGEVRPKTDITLTTQVAGKIVSVSRDFADGGAFSKGDLLVQIEADDYEIAVISAEAQLAQAEQALKLEQAESELARQDWKDLNDGAQGEASALTLRQPQLNQAKANYDAARANLEGARLSLKRTKIVAPFNGRVRSKLADLGQYVGPGQQIGRIFSTDVLEVRLPMTDNELAKINLPVAFIGKGPEVRFKATIAGAERSWTGHIVRTDAAIDPGTRQISVIAEVQDPYGVGADGAFPMAVGLFVTAEIKGPIIEDAIILPPIAVQNDNTVYIVNEDNTLEQVNVTVLATIARGTAVIGGVEASDKVVVSRLGKARVGEEVRPLPRSGTSPTKNDSASNAEETTESAK